MTQSSGSGSVRMFPVWKSSSTRSIQRLACQFVLLIKWPRSHDDKLKIITRETLERWRPISCRERSPCGSCSTARNTRLFWLKEPSRPNPGQRITHAHNTTIQEGVSEAVPMPKYEQKGGAETIGFAYRVTGGAAL